MRRWWPWWSFPGYLQARACFHRLTARASCRVCQCLWHLTCPCPIRPYHVAEGMHHCPVTCLLLSGSPLAQSTAVCNNMGITEARGLYQTGACAGHDQRPNPSQVGLTGSGVANRTNFSCGQPKLRSQMTYSDSLLCVFPGPPLLNGKVLDTYLVTCVSACLPSIAARCGTSVRHPTSSSRCACSF